MLACLTSILPLPKKLDVVKKLSSPPAPSIGCQSLQEDNDDHNVLACWSASGENCLYRGNEPRKSVVEKRRSGRCQVEGASQDIGGGCARGGPEEDRNFT